MTVEPLGNRVTLRTPETPKKIGTLWIPPEGEQNYSICQGVVTARGPKVHDVRIQPGAHVITKRFGGTPHDRERTLWTVYENAILAILVI